MEVLTTELGDVCKSAEEANIEADLYQKFTFIESKKTAVYKPMKKKIVMKDLLRLKGGKAAANQAKGGAVAQISRKRTNRTKARNMMPRTNGDSNNVRSSDDEYAIEKKIVLYTSKNKFMMYQDVCAICGSIGVGKDDCLMSCAQCGQCYHLFCVNIKLSKVMLQKGWRCLDCTVCEGCGQKNDEARLILCDECDISYHIYCMSPPLEAVPNGNWKCKSCTVCRKCGEKAQTYKWVNGCWECAECANKSVCFICSKLSIKNENAVHCNSCNKWLHTSCQNGFVSEDVPPAIAEDGNFQCLFCRFKIKHKFSPEDGKLAKLQSDGKIGDLMDISLQLVNDLNTPTHIVDGVFVSHQGLSFIKALTVEIKKKRKFRPANELPDGTRNPEGGGANGKLADSSAERNGETGPVQEEYKEGMIWVSAGSSPPNGFTVSMNNEGVNILKRKRQRNLQKVGIGGFNVKNRTLKSDEATLSCVSTFYANKKKKPLRRKLKNKINESYPLYLREAFFGKELLEPKPFSFAERENSLVEPPPPPPPTYKAMKQLDSLKAKDSPLSTNDLKEDNEILKCLDENPAVFQVMPINQDKCNDFQEIPLQVLHQPTEVVNKNKSDICTAPELSFESQFSLSLCSDQDTLPPQPATSFSTIESKKPILTENFCVKAKDPEKTPEGPTCGSQKTAEKMRIDEDLGRMATISAVLYSNTQHPELKKMYPVWNDRCKQILKIWRSLSTEKKAPFLQHAKENRSTLRLRRTQQFVEGISSTYQAAKEDDQKQVNIAKEENLKIRDVSCKALTPPNLNNVMLSDAPVYVTSNNLNHTEIRLFNNFNMNEEKADNTEIVQTCNYNTNVDDTQQLRNLLLKEGIRLTEDKMESPYTASNMNSTYQRKTTAFQKQYTPVVVPKKECPMEPSMSKNKFAKTRQDNCEYEKNDSDENGGFGDILGGLDEGDDDDLIKSLTAEIGVGDDFNILEYADPELDTIAENLNLQFS